MLANRLTLVCDVLGFDGQADQPVLAVNADHLHLDLITGVEHITCVFHPVDADLRCLQNAVDVFCQIDDGFLGFNFPDHAFNDRAPVIDRGVIGEGVLIQLLDAQGNPFTLRVHRENDRLDFFTLGVTAYGRFTRLIPGDVGQVHQTVDTTVQTDEDTEVGDGLDVAADPVALGIGHTKLFPGIGSALLHAQRNPAAFLVDIEDHHFHFVAHMHDFGWVDVLVGPVHLGNVHQAFHTLFDFGKAAVVGEVGNRGHDPGTFRITTGDGYPRIVAQLLHTQAHPILFPVELEDLHVHLVTDANHLGRMTDTAPGHIGDVQQTVHTAQIDERAVVCEVLDDAFDRLAFLKLRQQRFALHTVFFFEYRAAGNDYVIALLVEFDDLEFQRLAFQMCGLTQWSDVDQ